MQTGNIAAANGIRGFAVLIVVTLHSVGLFFRDISMNMAGTGKYGVWIFFVLSAFLLTYKFIAKGFGVFELFSYAVGRIARIIPLFAIAVITYQTYGLISPEIAPEVIKLREYYAHLWTIPVEFKYYLILPFVAYASIWTARYHGAFAASILLVIIIAAHQYFLPYYESQENTLRDFYHIPVFLYGSIVAIIFCFSTKRPGNFTSDVIAIFIVAAATAISPGGRKLITGEDPSHYLQNKYLFLGAAAAIFVYVIIGSNGIISRLMKTNAMQLLGKWSYSIYLFHWLILIKLCVPFKNDLPMMLLALAASICIGAAIYYIIESPIERARHAIMTKITERAMQQNAQGS